MRQIKELKPFLSGKESEIAKLYHIYREPFFAFIHKNNAGIGEEDIKEIYQESFIALWKNIRDKRLTGENLQASLKTYLFGIGKRQSSKHVRDRKPSHPLLYDFAVLPEKEIGKEEKEIIIQAIENLGKPCSQVLTLFYLEEKSLKEIAGIMGYKSEQVAKNKRFSCMENLKIRINKDDFY
ncbi:MAG: sigma-70 family RNA polymerase sigma factor [Bacteroidales bacterium]|nr:sigma-70 family RNA polymerase sigma factor [Bacteroidales bacterium]